MRRDDDGGGAAHRAAVHSLALAWEVGDASVLRVVLDPRVALVVDSGLDAGSVSSDGVDAVVHVLLQLRSVHRDLALQEQSVNGLAGLVCRDGSTVVAVVSAQVQTARIRRLWVVRNPAKLRAWNAGS